MKGYSLPTYKDYRRGTDFLPRVPSHWEVARTGTLFREIVDTGHPDLELLSINRFVGITKQSETGRKTRASKDRSTYKRILPGDIGYNLMNAFMGSIGVSTQEGLLSPAYAVARARRPVAPSFFHYLYRTPLYQNQFARHSYGIMYERNRLYFDRFKTITIPIPPLEEQQAIISFVKARDNEIARMIRSKKRLILVLKEQKQTLIQQKMMRGLNPGSDFRASGVEWLGEIPTHWDLMKIKAIASFNPSRSESESLRNSDGLTTFVPMESVTTNGRLSEPRIGPISSYWDGYTYFRRGDVVIAKITPCFENGKGGWLEELPTEFGFGTSEFVVLRARSRVLPAYLYQLTALRAFRLLGAQAMTGSAGQQRVPLDFIKNFVVPVPPLNEQRDLLEFIEAYEKNYYAAVDRATKEMDLILEYRDRLITDVVTGQVDVRGLQPVEAEISEDQSIHALVAENGKDGLAHDHVDEHQ